MARYLGSVCKLCHRVNGKLLLKGTRCFTPKCPFDRQRKTAARRRRRISDRGMQLIEKQKIRYAYGLLERQFKRTFNQAEQQEGITGDNLLMLLERRLDNVVYRLGFADSRSQARQLIQHGHLLLNGHKSTIPSRVVEEGDAISWTEHGTKTEYYKQLLQGIESKSIATWLSLDRQTLVGQVISLPVPDEVGAEFDSKAVVEYYSR